MPLWDHDPFLLPTPTPELPFFKYNRNVARHYCYRCVGEAFIDMGSNMRALSLGCLVECELGRAEGGGGNPNRR